MKTKHDPNNFKTGSNSLNHSHSQCYDMSDIDTELMTSESIAILAQQGLKLPLSYPQFKQYIPHRYPFMLIDRVTACQPGEWITAYKNLTMNEEFFQGHFPEAPIMPGVLIIEAMAQISGVLGFISEGITVESGCVYLFAGIDKVRFKHKVIAGDTLILRSTKLLVKRNIFKYSCTAHVGHTLAASAQIMIARQ